MIWLNIFSGYAICHANWNTKFSSYMATWCDCPVQGQEVKSLLVFSWASGDEGNFFEFLALTSFWVDNDHIMGNRILCDIFFVKLGFPNREQG